MIKKAITLTMMAGMLFIGVAFSQFSNTGLKKLSMAESAITQLYVDTINEEKLVEDAIKGMLENLDPHSSYSTPEETKELNEPLQGNFSGIGITFNMAEDTLYVISTVSGGPSEKVGIFAGDRIIAVNDTSIAGKKMKNSEIMKKLRGPKGTEVEVTVLRSNDTIPFNITRDDIPIYSVDAAYMVDGKTGYIRLNKFGAETPEEMRQAFKDLKKKGMENLILDLTDNGGGYLQAAVEILGEFLPPQSLAVYTEGLNSPRYDNLTRPHGKKPMFEDGRLVVMLNQYSASASEITAGAIQDWDRGLVVGRRSFGKGLVQRPIPLPDGSMIRLTVAHYYTPTGRDIQKPFEKGDLKGYNRDMENRFEHGELMHADSIKYDEKLKMKTLIKQRDIYGGGGIYPDSFVPLDTMEYTKYYRNLMAKGILNKYVIRYVDGHRAEIKKQFKTDDDFVNGFSVSPEMLNTIKEMGDSDGLEFNEEEMKRSEPLLKMIIKALIGRDIYENATYFKVYNRHDPVFKEALRLIGSDDYPMLLEPGPVTKISE